jgi:NAD(P)-dependent dehydrogenase (short-subunit alcohol dehydrogenase family)
MNDKIQQSTDSLAPVALITAGASGIGCAIAQLFWLSAAFAICAAKWALLGFTKTLAMEPGPFGIRVNAIYPGSVSGLRIEGVIEPDARRNNESSMV